MAAPAFEIKVLPQKMPTATITLGWAMALIAYSRRCMRGRDRRPGDVKAFAHGGAMGEHLGAVVLCVGQDAGLDQGVQRAVDDLDLDVERFERTVRVVPVHHVVLPVLSLKF